MRAVVPLAGLLGGCILTPDLSVGTQDAPVNSPPAIMSISSDDQQLGPSPGPVNFGVGQPSTAIVTLLDSDVTDQLTVRMYFDYNTGNQLPARVECLAANTGNAIRTATCDMHTLCVSGDTTATHDLQISVFDRPMMDPGVPEYQDPGPDGLSSGIFYHLNCF